MIHLIWALLLSAAFAEATEIPSRYVELLDYVQEAPDQGETNSCLFVASTGVMELIANKKAGIKHPKPYGTYDLSESYIIHAPNQNTSGKYSWELPVLRFNAGFGIHINEWDYSAWQGNRKGDVWTWRDWSVMKKTNLPKIQTIPLFVLGNKYSTHILNDSHIQMIKEALWTYKSPVLVNYVDDGYWHVISIVGYDDHLAGTCYDEETSPEDCGEKDKGSFFVRDSFGIPVEVRDYDWFKNTGNVAILVKEAK